MFELKYFAKIDAFEKAERSVTDPQPPPPFEIKKLGTDNVAIRAKRQLTWRFFLFAFWLLRTVWPVARVGRLVIVSRYDDVCAVLRDSEHFPVPFGPEMKTVTGGVIFALGLDGDAHAAQRAIMEAVVRPEDADHILERTRYFTQALIDGSGGRIDALRDLVGRVFTETCSEYFALTLDDPNAFLDRAMAITTMIFGDPFGTQEIRRLALDGAVRVRFLIDRSINAARTRVKLGVQKDAVIDRLVRQKHSNGKLLSTEEIRAIVIGIMTGMVPTSTLGGGKMLEELQRRGLLQRAIRAARAAKTCKNPEEAKEHRKALHDMLFEALRLNPALSPGLFRYAPKATSISGTHVPAGSIVLAGAMSALRDSRRFDSPGKFIAERPWGPLPGVQPDSRPMSRNDLVTLMFGGGSHGCLAAYLAMEQLTEIFQILLSQDDIRFSTKPRGKLSYLGLFPRRLDMEFRPKKGPTIQKSVTIQAAIQATKLADVQGKIEALGNPARLNSEMGKALVKTGVVHFASMSAFDAADPNDKQAEPDPRLVIELNIDGDPNQALRKIAIEAGPQLEPIFRCVKENEGVSLIDLLQRHRTNLHFMPWGATGLEFNGTPDCPVDDIERQNALATFARDALGHYLDAHRGLHRRAMDALSYVRSLTQPGTGPAYGTQGLTPAQLAVEAELRGRGEKLRDFLIRPTRRRLSISEWPGGGTNAPTRQQLSISKWIGSGTTVGLLALLKSRVGLFVALLIASTACLQGGAIHYSLDPDSTWIALALALLGAVSGAVLLAATLIRGGFDTLVRWYAKALDAIASLAVVLLVLPLDLLFVALLLARWIAWPAALLGTSAAFYWALHHHFSEIAPALQIALAAVAGIAATFVAKSVLHWLSSQLARHWRTATLATAGAAATYYSLQHWAPQLSLRWRIAAAVAVAAVIILAQVVWPRVARKLQPYLRAYGRVFGWFLVAVALAIVGYWAHAHFGLVKSGLARLGSLSVALGGGVMGTLLIWTTPVLAFLGILYWHEQRDVVDERTAPLDKLEKIADKENPKGYAHNHITAVTPLKRGAFRRLTLALSLWGIGKLVRYWFRPGFVLNMGTIHYARWFRLPGSQMLVFFSNYDGSWQSYLEDFITKAHWGQSAAWSNGWGFPKTLLLIFKGAQDGDRFKRWVRRQQIVTQFWFSRFPELTTDQIRNHALIHHGLMHAQTDTAARAWLDCFGTIPRPRNTIESDEVQSLVFRGFGDHQHMICAAITFSSNVGDRNEWLKSLPERIVFGEQPDPVDETQTEVFAKTATFVAFSARGLAKCLGCKLNDKTDATMVTFPPAFRVGMADRSKILRDEYRSAPLSWAWADVDRWGDKAVDAVLFIYGETEQACLKTLDYHLSILKLAPVRMVVTQPTAKTVKALTDATKKKSIFEHFGFRDGISQPIIRGSQREAAATNRSDVIAPGEFILGYEDSSGYTAPAMTLPAERDSRNDLPTDTPDFPSSFPRFGESHASDLRDFGRNGTFVAIRQLKQDVKGFRDFTEDCARALQGFPGINDVAGGRVSSEWVAAKMMGRWRTGASLIRWPNAVSDRAIPDIQDNDFSFGKDDPQGLRCPLGAHIRRANPRGSLAPDDPVQEVIEKRHRLLRRGRPYEMKVSDQVEQGLLFVGLCADLERQFEFLQQSWIDSPNFHGLTNEPDPVTAGPRDLANVFTIPTASGPLTLKNLPNFVTVRAGGYFFMPSRSAIRFLANVTGQSPATNEPATTAGAAHV